MGESFGVWIVVHLGLHLVEIFRMILFEESFLSRRMWWWQQARAFFVGSMITNNGLRMNEGLTRLAVQSLTIAGTGDWYVGTSSGAFRSDDGGAHWKNISQGLGIQMTPKGPYD